MSEYDQIPCVELIRHYRPGGFHPVHLNDTFNNGRYRVINKLGHGGFSTVWLVKDEITQKYASLKILAAEASDSERLILRHLQRNCLDDRGGEYVLRLLDDFVHSGPNGDHQCIVTEVLGPSLASDIEDLYPDEQFPIDIAKRMSAQITHGIQYLHRNGVVHGDLYLRNILLAPFSLSERDIERFSGTPRVQKLTLPPNAIPQTPPDHLPKYVVHPVNPTPILNHCLSVPSRVHVKICDFGESFFWNPNNQIPRKMGVPRGYAAPEVIFDENPGPPCDVWALAVLTHVLVSGGVELFPCPHGLVQEVLREMVLALGEFPERWWKRWAERGQYFDENGNWVGDNKCLSSVSGRLIKVFNRLTERETSSFEMTIRKMVGYEPKERAVIDEVVKEIPSSWLTTNGGESHADLFTRIVS